MRIDNIEKEVVLFVVNEKNFEYDILLGLDSISNFQLKQDFDLNIYQRLDMNEERKIDYLNNNNNNNNDFTINFNEGIPTELFEAKLDHLETNQRSKIEVLINKYDHIFAKHKFDIGQVQNNEAHIKLLEHKFIAKKPYRCSMEDQKEIEFQIGRLLKANLIEESSSPFASPVTLAYKRDEGSKTRLCVDFRELNKLIVPEPQPFPLIDEILAKTRNAKFFTTLDVNSAFWSIPIRIKDRYKTAFVTQNGHWQWKCLPFGLKTSPAIFQRILNNIIRKYNLNLFCLNYIDDILIFSSTFDEHIEHLDNLLNAICNEGFRLKFIKCNFAEEEVKYLGHIVGNNTVRPINDNLISIRNFSPPDTRKKIRQFLGKVNFYHKYIKDSARLLEPLHNLLRKDVKFNWSLACQEAFNKVKDILCSEPILAIFDPSAYTTIYTDASIQGVGAVLKQKQINGEMKPVAYFSKKLNKYQKNKKAIFLECLAIKEAIKFWKYWLMGHKFIVVTDHKPLEGKEFRTRPDEELGDMMNFLSQFDFEIRYEPGKGNVEADCLSRNPVLEETENMDECIRTVNLVELNEIKNDQQNNLLKINSMRKTVVEKEIHYKLYKNNKKIILSNDFGKDLIRKVHKHYGHICASKINNKIRKFYYIQNMDSLTKEVCGSCDICCKNKTRVGQKYGLLSQLGPAKEPFEIMSLDTIGGFAGNRSSKRYLHLLVDHFTRYAFASTSKHQTTEDFIKLINKIQDKRPIKTLLTDQYPEINSEKFRQHMRSLNIQLIFTTVDCPSSNGLNERLNQTLVNRIRCKQNETKTRAWTKIADECIEEYNRTDHSTTGYSPEYLLCGRTDPIAPEELIEERNLPKDREIAYKNSLRYHEYNKKLIDKNRKHYDFKIGDYVYVENKSKLNKKKT